MRVLINLLVVILPWFLKRLILVYFYKYEISKKAYIGFSYIFPKKLIMLEGSSIGHFNVGVNLDLIKIGFNSIIDRSNWITGFSTKVISKHFSHDKNRASCLIIGDESAITKKHHFDCTNIVNIGNFVTVAGYSSQFLTHSIDIYNNRQDSLPIEIGDYCFVSTNVILLGGSILPSRSILGAGSLLNKKFFENNILYAGVPAKRIKFIENAKYFNRINGFVY